MIRLANVSFLPSRHYIPQFVLCYTFFVLVFFCRLVRIALVVLLNFQLLPMLKEGRTTVGTKDAVEKPDLGESYG